MLELSIDAADDAPGVALSANGSVSASANWRSERNHSVELLPNIDRLIADDGHDKSDVTAIFVDIGPGGYAALRVGVSIAKALAHALAVPLVGIGRLELNAYNVRDAAGGRRIVAVHVAGRGEIAWAAYREDGEWREESSPRITKHDQFYETLQADDAVAGDVDETLAGVTAAAGAIVVTPEQHRVIALAALGAKRRAAGRTDDPTALVPLYLRAPAIGPQR
jgi:tRNA threonylcarbamoyladenosine biosynthesis protein TsaB